jgi:CubicO group peptidase (beta-lactamase class C family)/peptidoglycan/LPS O-acetylase OafA/YrhL
MVPFSTKASVSPAEGADQSADRAVRMPTKTRPRQVRDPSLDGLRGIALLRVILWHATGWAPVTWIVAAMPAMFAVTGSLLVRSVERHGWRTTLWRRATRLFPSLWLYSTFVVVSSRLNGAQTSPLWTFYLPVLEPASTLGDGWFTTPMWYLRAYLWVLAISPLLAWSIRRVGAAAVVVGAAATVLVALRFDPGDRVGALLGDLLLYGTFTAGGMCFLAQRRAGAVTLGATALTALAAGLLWLPGHRPLDDVVNSDHLAHLIVGAFSCAVLLLARAALARAASWRYIALLSRHSVTVYLWHSGVAWTVWHLQPASWPQLLRASVTFGATLAIVPLVVFTVGDVETRPEGWWRPKRQLARLSAILVVAAALAVPGVRERLQSQDGPSDLPLPPSQAPIIAPVVVAASVAEFVARQDLVDSLSLKGGEILGDESRPKGGESLVDDSRPNRDEKRADESRLEPDEGPVDASQQERDEEPVDQSRVERDERPADASRPKPAERPVEESGQKPGENVVDESWVKRTEMFQAIIDRANKELGLKGLRAVVTTADGHTWSGATADAKPFDEKSRVGSITKTFTATLVHRLIERGKLSLDTQVGDLGIGFKYPRLTVGQLLNHTSGLANFRSTKEFERDGVTPEDVLRWAGARRLTFIPGGSSGYSSTGYLALGLLVEQITGESYEAVLRREIVTPRQLDMEVWRSRYHSVGHATAGVSIGPVELARWGRMYFVDRLVTEKPWDWRVRHTQGDGVQAYCPCEEGRFMALGYLGGRTMVSGDGDGVVVVLDARGVLSGPNIEATQTYAQELRLVAGGGKTFAYQRR